MYKEDFEAERKVREEAAGKQEEELARLQILYSKALAEHDHIQRELTKALAGAQKELVDSKKLPQSANENAAKEKAAARNEMENVVQQLQEQLRNVTDSHQTEVAEVRKQLSVALMDKEALSDESLAKTQQVKQYKKQVDTFRIQLQESSARIEEYKMRLHQSKHELAHCQRDLQAREEDKQSEVRQ